MNPNNLNPASKSLCPRCGQEHLTLSNNAQYRFCKHCNYKVEITVSSITLQNLIEDTTRPLILADDSYKTKLSNNSRIWLVQGMSSAQANEMDEAYRSLIKLLRTSWDDEDRTKAWISLSQVMSGVEEKKYCLERALLLEPGNGYARKSLAILNGRLNPDEIIVPELLKPKPKDESIEIEAEQHVCPRCASPLIYHPAEQVLLCEYCHYQESIDNNLPPLKQAHFGEGAYEQEFTIALATAKGHLAPIQMRTFHCHRCAVEFVLSPETISITCPYCRAVYTTQTTESRETIPPHALIPFFIDKRRAIANLRSWFKKHNIKRPRMLSLLGIYLPVWTFDIGGEIKWSRNHSEIMALGFVDPLVSEKNRYKPSRELQIKKLDSKLERLKGTKPVFYNDLLVPANKKSMEFTKQFTEYDLSNLTDFDTHYLADWPAQRYQVLLSDASLQARKIVVEDVRKNTHANIVQKIQLNTADLVVESYKQILLPIWIAHYQIDKQEYKVTVNGQNGKVYGSKPKGKIARFFSYLLGT